jgi:carotenoid cleavage dioxygenase-like enzyme
MPGTVHDTDHRLGFQTLDREADPGPLQVQGQFPDWLAGTLLRTGPAKFEVGTRSYNHWFDGLAMLHRFSFAAGTVTYANRFVRSRAYQAAAESGQMRYSEFATDPCRTLFQRVTSTFSPPRFGDNANVSVVRLGDEFLALTETPLPVVFDPQTLETLGVAAPAPGQQTVAHPHRSPASGDLVSYATHFGPASTYRVYTRRDARAPHRVIATLPAARPSYMHSFAATGRYVVLVEFPFVVTPVAIPLSGRPFIDNYRWKPGRGTRFRVVDTETGRVRATAEGEAFFAFHHVNAQERDRELLIDVCAYDDAEIVAALRLDRLRSGSRDLPAARLRRYRIPLDGGDVRREDLSSASLELPRIDYSRCNGLPYRYVYGAGAARDGDFLNQIVKIDVERGEASTWAEPGTYPGEPVFVRSPDARREDSGVLLSVVLDPADGRSFLLVLDAASLGELARARLPHHVPFGFHGAFASGL